MSPITKQGEVYRLVEEVGRMPFLFQNSQGFSLEEEGGCSLTLWDMTESVQQGGPGDGTNHPLLKKVPAKNASLEDTLSILV